MLILPKLTAPPVSNASLSDRPSARINRGTSWIDPLTASVTQGRRSLSMLYNSFGRSLICNTPRPSTLSYQSSVSRIKLELIAAPHQLPNLSRRSAHTTLVHRDTRQRRPCHFLQQTQAPEELGVDVHDLQDADRPDGKRVLGDEDSRSEEDIGFSMYDNALKRPATYVKTSRTPSGSHRDRPAISLPIAFEYASARHISVTMTLKQNTAGLTRRLDVKGLVNQFHQVLLDRCTDVLSGGACDGRKSLDDGRQNIGLGRLGCREQLGDQWVHTRLRETGLANYQ